VLQADFWQRTQLVYAIHPSRSVNFEKTDAQMRKQLLRSICEACEKLDGRWDEDSWEERFLNGELSIPQAMPASESRFTRSEDTKCVETFLGVILKLCFLPQHRLPSQSIVPRLHCQYHLEHWHEKWFRHMETYRDAIGYPEHQARSLLIPVFKQLNRSFRRNSWFLPAYEVDWAGVHQAFTDRPLEFEHACYLLTGGTESDMDRAASGVDDGPRHEDGINSLGHVLTTMEKITAHAMKLWQNGRPHLLRTHIYIGFG
jgi:hypothetical protein